MLHLLLVPVVVQNASFSVPVPDGYKDVSGMLRVKNILGIMKGTPGGSDAASINFVPTAHHPEEKLDDAKECAAFAEDMREHQSAERGTSAIVDGPTGKTCQISLTYPKMDAIVLSTILRGPKDSWIMTCTAHPKDTPALEQCQKTLRAVKFK